MQPKPHYHIAPRTARTYSIPFKLQESPVYAYTLSYSYPWIKRPESLLKRCEFDDGGYMELTDTRLIIFEDWRKRQFSLPQIKGAQIAFKRLIGPLIIGGIVAPLAFIGAFSQAFSFWFGMAFFLVGALLFYYGTQGSYQVCIAFEGHDFRFFIDEKTEEVEEFIAYINQLGRIGPHRVG